MMTNSTDKNLYAIYNMSTCSCQRTLLKSKNNSLSFAR